MIDLHAGTENRVWVPMAKSLKESASSYDVGSGYEAIVGFAFI